MKRAIIKFLSGGDCNLPADYIDADENYISVFNDGILIGIFNLSCVKAAFISEKNEVKDR